MVWLYWLQDRDCMPNWYTINHPTKLPTQNDTQWPTAARTLHCRIYPAGKVAISPHLATPSLTILSASSVRKLVHRVVKYSRPPDLKSSSNVSLPFDLLEVVSLAIMTIPKRNSYSESCYQIKESCNTEPQHCKPHNSEPCNSKPPIISVPHNSKPYNSKPFNSHPCKLQWQSCNCKHCYWKPYKSKPRNKKYF